MEKLNALDSQNREMLDLISAAGAVVPVRELASRLYISEATVRRRLSSLEASGLIIRTHGGAMIDRSREGSKNLPLFLRSAQLDREKSIIAQKAVSLISDGDTVFIDSSSTTLYLLPRLSGFKDLTVCTNSLKAAAALGDMQINCILFGGDLIASEQACNSAETYEMIKRVNADLFFFSCDALSDDGLVTDNSKHTSLLRAQYMKNAERSVLLIDHTKLHKKCWYTLCDLQSIDTCVCDSELPSDGAFASVQRL